MLCKGNKKISFFDPTYGSGDSKEAKYQIKDLMQSMQSMQSMLCNSYASDIKLDIQFFLV